MAIAKPTTVTIRIGQNVKDALRAAAELERRSITNMVEVMVREHCKKAGIPVAEIEKNTFSQNSKTNQNI